jgi:hypothetical protein
VIVGVIARSRLALTKCEARENLCAEQSASSRFRLLAIEVRTQLDVGTSFNAANLLIEADMVFGGESFVAFGSNKVSVALVVVIIELEPHGVQHAEGAGQTEAENPGKIPHVVSPHISVIVIVAFFDRRLRHRAAQHVIDPGRVSEDDRQEENRSEKHKTQRRLAR